MMYGTAVCDKEATMLQRPGLYLFRPTLPVHSAPESQWIWFVAFLALLGVIVFGYIAAYE